VHAFSIFAADIFCVIISYSTDQSLKSTKKVHPPNSLQSIIFQSFVAKCCKMRII
jgi:hypothetical protein